MTDAIELSPADPNWPAAFTVARASILPCFHKPPLLIEHMGSTAIPGLPAKPIIDMIVLVEDLQQGHAAAVALEVAGFVYRADYADTTKLLFMKRDAGDGRRTHHLHVHEDADEVSRHLIFRDALRDDDTLRDAYRDLKQALALRFRDDRMAYSRYKTAFVDQVVRDHGGPARRVHWDPLQ